STLHFLLVLPHPRSPPFPYTTLFRSLGARHRHPRERPDRRDPRAGVLGARRHLTPAPAEPLVARRAPAPACTRAGSALSRRSQRATDPLGRGEPASGRGDHALAATEAG